MTNTIFGFYPQLASHPDVRELVQAEFGDDAAPILQGMADGDLGRDQDEELEGLLTEFIVDHGKEVKTYKGLGGSLDSQQSTSAYFEQQHPEAVALIEKMGGAPGFESSEFSISVLRYGSLYVVVAEDFEDAWFDSEKRALEFAEQNYEPWISGFKKHHPE